MRSLIYIALILGCCFTTNAQRFADQVPSTKKYTSETALDSIGGIKMYNKLVPFIGGDSVRYNKSGYNLQGWQEDYYSSGKILHKGFYVDGQIKVFKNFYESGQIERSFITSDPARCSVDIYYPNGKVQKQILYYNGNAQNEYTYFDNGNPESIIEKDKDVQFLFKKSKYYENGHPASELELVDKKTKKYVSKEYFENGKLKEEGYLSLNSEKKKYEKEGEWVYYDEKGEPIKKEKYKGGKLQP